MTDYSMTFDWGARSEALRKLHAALKPTKSFLLTTAPLPVRVRILTSAQVADWDDVDPPASAVTAVPNTFTARVDVPDTTKFIRLDFELRLTIGSATATCLEFRQLFSVGVGGSLMPSQYSFAEVTYQGTDRGPVQQPGTGRRIMLGTCPLISVRASTIEINCEFLDVTDLWWANWAAKDQWGWYLDPDVGGRQDLLRVLAWTSGTAPMIWFAAIPPQAANGSTASPATGATRKAGADIVFFRAQAGFNSFPYAASEAGFLDSRHGNTTMQHMARWMLSPLSFPDFSAKQKKMQAIPNAGPNQKPYILELLSVRMIPLKTTPVIDPKDPMDLIAKFVDIAFRPVGIEGALGRSACEDIALLPVGFDGSKDTPFASGGGYTALMKNGELSTVMSSIRKCLWVRNATGRSLTATPDFSREIWLLANSGANGPLFQTLRNNAADIDRVVICDATKVNELLIPSGIPAIEFAAQARARLRKSFRAFCVTTPNAWNSKTEYMAIKAKMTATASSSAVVTMLPLDTEWDAYWTYPPTAATNPLLFETLRNWENNGLDKSQRMGTVKDGRQFLFWHEWSVDGGHLEPASPITGVQSHVRTFFEDVLLS